MQQISNLDLVYAAQSCMSPLSLGAIQLLGSMALGSQRTTASDKKNIAFYGSTKVFMGPLSPKHDILVAGEKAMMLLYMCPGSISTLNPLHLKFIEKVTESASYIESKVLPHTSDACSFPSFGIY